jgi:hypothetical protein
VRGLIAALIFAAFLVGGVRLYISDYIFVGGILLIGALVSLARFLIIREKKI